MKKLYLKYADCLEEGYHFLAANSIDIDIVDDGSFWLADYATGARMISTRDTLEVTVNEQQETAIRFRFWDKISESV